MTIVRIMRLDGDPDELAGKYQRVQETLRAAGIPFPADGMRVHIAAKTADGFRVANVWDSGEQADAAFARPQFQEALRAAGLSPEAMRIEQHEVVNLITA